MQCPGMGAFQHHRGGFPRLEGGAPTGRANAPLIAVCQSGKPKLEGGGDEVIALLSGIFEEIIANYATYGV